MTNGEKPATYGWREGRVEHELHKRPSTVPELAERTRLTEVEVRVALRNLQRRGFAKIDGKQDGELIWEYVLAA